MFLSLFAKCVCIVCVCVVVFCVDVLARNFNNSCVCASILMQSHIHSMHNALAADFWKHTPVVLRAFVSASCTVGHWRLLCRS